MSNPVTEPDNTDSPAPQARSIVRRAKKAGLATMNAEAGGPFVSLATVATGMSGAPVVLLSDLARHTRDVKKDPRVSLLFDASGENGDPLEGARVSVSGELAKSESPHDRARFLERHRSGAGYADFADFAFYRLHVAEAYLVGGFGRIHSVPADDFLIGDPRAGAFEQAEPGILEHMNADHSDAIALYATHLLAEPEGPWRMCGFDPDGFDLSLSGALARFEFPTPLAAPADARRALAELAGTARGL